MLSIPLTANKILDNIYAAVVFLLGASERKRKKKERTQKID